MSRETSLWKSRLRFVILDRILDMRFARIGLPHVSLIIPLYITLLHLCLSVDAEILRIENRDAFPETLPIPPVANFKSKPSPSFSTYENGPQPAIRRRRLVPVRSTVSPAALQRLCPRPCEEEERLIIVLKFG